MGRDDSNAREFTQEEVNLGNVRALIPKVFGH